MKTIYSPMNKIFSEQNYYANSIPFEAIRMINTGSTSAGNPLKKLRGLTCPYFGTPLLTGKQINMVEKTLDKCSNIKEVVDVLADYKKYMQKIEKQMYHKFVDFSKISPDASLEECLKTLYNKSITKLKLEEFNVLDDIDKISLRMSPENALLVHSKTTRCREIILENNQENTFKRKTLLDSLNEIKPSHREYQIFKELKNRAEYLPTSGTSINAFVVKYYNRTQQEIAKRLVRPSMYSIEHIKPHSSGGKDTLDNFMLASTGANSKRSSLPLPKFIEMYPNIPKNCQKYIDQIIEKINRNEFQGHETYPYKLKHTLFTESQGLVNLNLEKYKYTLDEAKTIEKKHYQKMRESKKS